ncbi:MAG: hypothetical protein CM1200mP3_04170 [Chloroflexota bacterium]|nr:MAG: hypothetical protein CM1200mP3_04170 [Chloroflexota bacterium]
MQEKRLPLADKYMGFPALHGILKLMNLTDRLYGLCQRMPHSMHECSNERNPGLEWQKWQEKNNRGI